MGCGSYDILVLGTHERYCRKCRPRRALRGQDILDPTPAQPEPPERANQPVIVKDVTD